MSFYFDLFNISLDNLFYVEIIYNIKWVVFIVIMEIKNEEWIFIVLKSRNSCIFNNSLGYSYFLMWKCIRNYFYRYS